MDRLAFAMLGKFVFGMVQPNQLSGLFYRIYQTE